MEVFKGQVAIVVANIGDDDSGLNYGLNFQRYFNNNYRNISLSLF